MSDTLRRLLEEHDDLEVTRVLSAGLDDQPSDESFARAARALGVGTAAALTLGAAAVASKSAAGGTGGGIVAAFFKWLGVGLLLGSAVVSPLALRSTSPEAAREPASHAAPPEPVPAPPRLALAAQPTPSAEPAPRRRAPPAPAPAPPPAPAAEPEAATAKFDAPPPSALEAEIATLDAARRALKGGDPAAALATLERAPARALAAEASLLRVQALVAAGRVAEAQQIALAARRARGDDGYACRLVKLAGLAGCPK